MMKPQTYPRKIPMFACTAVVFLGSILIAFSTYIQTRCSPDDLSAMGVQRGNIHA